MASVSGQKSEVDLTPLSNIKNALSDLFVTFKEVKDTAIKVQGSMVLSESGSSTVTTTYQNDGGESFTATATTSTSTKHEMEDGIRVLKKLGNKVGTTTSTATSTAKR